MEKECKQKDLLLSKLTLDLIVEMIFWIDSKGNFFLVNKSACENLEYSQEELLKLSVPEVDDKNTSKEFIEKWDQAEKHGRTSFEVCFLTRTGKTFPAEIIANLVEFEGDKYLCAVARNIAERKDVENTLIASEERYRTLFESADDAIFIMDRDKFVDCNQKTLEIFGYSERQDIIGHSPWEFSPQKQPDGSISIKKAKTFIKDALSGDPQKFYWKHTRLNGDEFDAEVSLNRVVIRDKVLLQAIVRDRTEEIAILNALEESEEKFHKAFNNNPNSLHITSIPEGNFIEVNSLFLELSGYKKEELIGKSAVDLDFYVRPEDRDKAFAELQEKGRLVDYEITFKVRSGEHLLCRLYSEIVDIKGKPHLVSIVQNITEKTESEDALRESEEKFRIMVEASPDAVTTTDLEAKISFASSRTAEIHGYSNPAELIGMNAFELVVPEERENAVQNFILGFEKGILREKEYMLYRKDGSTFEGEITGSVLKDKFGNPVGSILVSRDITQRKANEKALIESEERYRLLIENIPSVVWKTYRNMNTSFISSNVEQCYGYSPDEIYQGGASLFIDRVHPDDREYISKSFQELFEQGIEYNVEYRIKTKDGRWIWLQDRASIVQEEDGKHFTYGVFSDITERRLAENMIKEKEAWNRATVEAIPDLLFRIDKNGTYMDISGPEEDLFLPAEKLLGKRFTDILPAETAEPLIKEITKALENNQFSSMEYSIPTIKGELQYFEGRISPINSNEVLFIARNITEKKKSEKEIETYQENLRSMANELNLVEEKERRRIAVNLHDHLSQSLALAKINLTSIMKKSLSPDISKDLRETNRYITDAIERSRSITYDLSPPILFELGLSPAIQWKLEQVENNSKIKTSINVDTEVPDMDEDYHIFAFRSVSELINNAVKHAKASHIDINLKEEKGLLIIKVDDDGIGFNPEKKVRPVSGKSGFGLFSIQERLGYFNGKLEIASETNKGTSVVITIPFLS